MISDRPDTDLAAVDQALAMPDKRDAAAFLAARGAGFALTCRVLTQPGARRESAVSAQAGPAAQ